MVEGGLCGDVALVCRTRTGTLSAVLDGAGPSPGDAMAAEAGARELWRQAPQLSSLSDLDWQVLNEAVARAPGGMTATCSVLLVDERGFEVANASDSEVWRVEPTLANLGQQGASKQRLGSAGFEAPKVSKSDVGEGVFVLASDGLWRCLWPQEVRRCVGEGIGAAGMISLIRTRRGYLNDDASLIVVRTMRPRSCD